MHIYITYDIDLQKGTSDAPLVESDMLDLAEVDEPQLLPRV